MTKEQEIKYNAEPIYRNGVVVSYAFSPMSNGIKYFVDTYGADLVKALKGTGVYFSVAAAQKIVESGFGTSAIANKYNNFGGIKYGGGVRGATGSSNGTSKGYAIYPTAFDCFHSYVNGVLLDPTKKYIGKGLLTATDPTSQLMAIANGGYCENPADPKVYAKPIIKVIDIINKMYSLGKIK
jgi:N-acetylmuramoyl-L-alanine amidase